MNLDKIKPETLAAGVMDLTPSQSLAAHEYAERLNAALARLGLTDRLTLPPAPNTAIDELPAVVDVPMRKTLSVLMGKAQQGDASALATLEWTAQVAESIFAGLHARASVYPLALPSDESLATLSQGVDALLPRKISTGWSVASLLADPTCDGIDDGVSLVRLLCSAAADSVTELKDDNEGWTFANNSIFTIFKAQEYHLNCVDFAINASYGYNYGQGFLRSNNVVKVLDLPYFEGFIGGSTTSPAFYCYYAATCNALEALLMPSLWRWNGENQTNDKFNIANCPNLRKVVFGSVRQASQTQFYFSKCPNLIHLEFGQGTSASLNLAGWNPTSVLSDSERLPIFLSNFKTYIAERLKGGYAVGTGPTLTLSQAVRDAIEGDPTIAQIITSKGWSISPAPSV